MKIIHKDVLREIKVSTGRFVSLFLIVALGVAVYAGIRSSKPDMMISADAFYDESNLEDIRVMSTLGMTDEDVEALAKVDGIKKAVGTYTSDFICHLGDSQYVVKLMAITDGINEITLESGRMPQADNECLIDNYYMNLREYEIGDTIEIFSGDDTDPEEIVNVTEFTVTGSFVSSEYLSMTMGNTTIGSGKIEGLMAVKPSVFALDVYTEVDLLVDGAKDLMCYSDEYEDLIDEEKDKIEEIREEREQARYDSVIGEANEELDKAKKEYDDGKAELDDAKQQYDDGKAELENAKNAYYNGINELDEKRAELTKGESDLAAAKTELANQKNALQAQKDSTYAEISRQQSALDEQRAKLEAGHEAGLIPDAQYQAALEQIEAGQAQINAAKTQADTEFAAYDTKIAAGEQEIAANEQKIEDGKAAIADAEAQLYQAEIDIANGEKELEDAEKEIADGEKELKDAEKELDDAEREISKIEKAEWFILGRNYLTEYTSFKSDAERIGNIGKVFPMIFFIVAALVCLTTMTRMVDEERTQIGTLKALGYGKGMIMRKYIVYALLATLFGSVAGALAGGKIFPFVILNVYKILYPNIDKLYFPYNLEHSLVAAGASIVCILAATFFACTKSLLEQPAELMRPVAPKQAKKLLLERIPGLWSRIRFTWKNALRNFVRYKKRLFMTLFGIAGSTALLLVGFGLKDSINTILYSQFGSIDRYDEVVIIDGDATERNKEELSGVLENDARFGSFTYIYQSALDAESANTKEVMNVYLFVPEDMEALPDNVDLRDRVTQEKIPLEDDTVLISEKMANQLKLKAGDTFQISSGQKDKKTLTVGGIVENYVYHYIYMSPALYESLYGHQAEYNQILIKNSEGANVDPSAFGEEFLKYDAVGGVMCVESLIEQFEDILSSLDSITLVLIVCAAGLTFVVLFNLNNINISERRRELATLKVLGFYDIELSQYIYRENVLITIIGVAIGVVFGIFLNRFVVTTVEVDIVMFGRQIFFPSFVKSILIAIGFAVIVNLIVHLKLKKIDMATSLKSVE